MDVHLIDAVPNLAQLSLPDGAAIDVTSVGTSSGGAAGMTGAQQHGANKQAALTKHKRLATLRAALARRGFELDRTCTGSYILMRRNQARTQASLNNAQEFVRRVGELLS